MAKVKISELPALTPATLDTTYVVGISGSTTYKISINQLTSSLDTTFATDLVTAALSSSLNGKLSTSSYTTDSSSFDNRIKNSQPIGYLTTASYTTDSSSFNSRIISGSSVAGTISGSAQISALGFVSGSYLTSLNGALSSSAQVLNGSNIFSSSTQLPTGLVSSSSQIFIGSGVASGSYETTGRGIYSSSAQLPIGLISGSSQLTTAFPSKTTGAWSVPAGASTQSFSVESGASYTMWVNGNIPNGIITWNAMVTTSNTNVPVVGSQYGWYYTPGNQLVLTTIPDQIIGTNGSIANTPTSYAPNTSNVFKFGITNNSGTTQTINYGYIKLS